MSKSLLERPLGSPWVLHCREAPAFQWNAPTPSLISSFSFHSFSLNKLEIGWIHIVLKTFSECEKAWRQNCLLERKWLTILICVSEILTPNVCILKNFNRINWPSAGTNKGIEQGSSIITQHIKNNCSFH